MEEGDAWICAAMNGKQSLDAAPSESRHTATFFYVLFGLVYETLATSKPDPHMPHDGNTRVALRALKCLVHPQFAGDVFLDTTVFEELVHLLYRLALTETPVAQIHLLEALTSLSQSLNPTNRYVSRERMRTLKLRQLGRLNGATQSATSSYTSSTTHCLKIVSYILKRSLPGSHDYNQCKWFDFQIRSWSNNRKDVHAAQSERVTLVNTGFKAYSEVMKRCNPGQQIQFQILGLYLYHGASLANFRYLWVMSPKPYGCRIATRRIRCC